MDKDIEESIKIEVEYLKLRSELINEVMCEVGGSEQGTFTPKLLEDIRAEPTEIVCKDFLPLIKGAYNIIAGAGGVGKSTLALRSVLHYLRANPTDRALLVMGEDDRDEIKERIEILASSFLYAVEHDVAGYLKRMDFITVDNPVSMRFLENQRGSATINDRLVSDFKKYIKENNIGFVVLDPLKKFHSVDENSNSEMDLLVRDVFLEIAGELKIVMLILHHSSKSAEGTGSRGASTISDTSRIAYRVSKVMITKEGVKIEHPDFKGQVRINTIKDNKNIYYKYGRRNTQEDMIHLYKGVEVVEYREVS